MQSLAGPRSQPIALEVLRINLLQLRSIDHLAQTFSARYFVHLRIKNGCVDHDLLKDIDESDPKFPRDTQRPGASWFLRQIDLPTALEHRMVDLKVVIAGSDIDLVFKVTGTFFATMQLQNFPVDVQRLCMVIAVNCASEGIVPVKFDLTKDAAVTVAKGSFALSNLWGLHDRALVEHDAVEPMPATTYPALRISTLVWRKPIYFLVNVIVPMSSLTFLGLLQFLLEGERESTNTTFRITYSVTILLTTATYKLFIASALPIGLAYMTLLDQYVLFLFMLQVAVVTETAVVGSSVMRSEASSWLPAWATSPGDLAAGAFCLAIFLLGHMWFFCRWWSASSVVDEQIETFAMAEHNRSQSEAGLMQFTRYRRKASMGSGSGESAARGKPRLQRQPSGIVRGGAKALPKQQQHSAVPAHGHVEARTTSGRAVVGIGTPPRPTTTIVGNTVV